MKDLKTGNGGKRFIHLIRVSALILLFIGAIAKPLLAGEDRIEIMIKKVDRETLIRITDLGMIVASVKDDTARVFGYRHHLEKLDAMKYDWTPVATADSDNRRILQDYPDLKTLTTELQSIAADYPSICRLYNIGESEGGNPLWLMKISDNPDAQEDEPELKYIASMHGDEPPAMVLCLYLIQLLTGQYGIDPRITCLVDDIEIWIMPLMNPDGYANQSRFNANGFDLNREFPDRVKDPNNTVQGRPIEVQHVMNWGFEHSPVLAANFHTGALLVNYPYDSDPNPYANYSACPDDRLFIEMALSYSSLNSKMYNSQSFDRGIVNGVQWYQIYGGMEDWNYVWMGCNEVTIELTDDYRPPFSELTGLWEDNRQSMLAYMQWCLKGVRGVVTDSETGLPVSATVRVYGIDHAVYTDPDVGDYHRILLPGTYDIQITAQGYQTRTVRSIQVQPDAATRVDIQMEKMTDADSSIASGSDDGGSGCFINSVFRVKN